MIVADLVAAIESVAPPELAEPWDNVGLLVGRSEATLRGCTLLTIDFTEAVLEEARAAGAGAVIAYHPPIFQPLKRLTSSDARGRTLLAAAELGLAVYSPHTALDATAGGVTDWLCDMLAPDEDIAGIADASGVHGRVIGDRRALRPHMAPERGATHKIVVFVPAEHADALRDGLASVGAGRIGLYERCSFNIAGEGTFHGGAGTNPARGEAGRLERVAEVRMEMVCGAEALGLVAEIIRQFHPYETPAWDVYPLAGKPDRSVGAGRRLTLDKPATCVELAKRLKSHLGVESVLLARAHNEPVTRVGVCPGAGSSLLEDAIAAGCQTFVTGEMKHHEAASALARGCSVILAGHTNTERGYLPHLARRLEQVLPKSKFVVSQTDRALFKAL